MASTISTVGFDAAFPVAGQDNDSQGFRTNFNVTKVGLETAADEITVLQNTAARLNANNAFNGSVISEAEFKQNTETVYSYSMIDGDQEIKWTNGHYQTLQAGADIKLTLADWPESGVMGRMRLQITGDGTTRTITWDSDVSGSILTDSNPIFVGDTIEVTATNTYIIIDFWTINGGVSVFANYVGTFN